MFDKRIDERIRKPRRAKGTPFYTQRNYWALAVLGFGAVSWFLFDFGICKHCHKHCRSAKHTRQTQPAKKIKRLMKETDFFDTPEGIKLKIKHIQAGRTSGPVDELLIKAREREFAKYEKESQVQSWFSKLLDSRPEI